LILSLRTTLVITLKTTVTEEVVAEEEGVEEVAVEEEASTIETAAKPTAVKETTVVKPASARTAVKLEITAPACSVCRCRGLC